MNIRVWLAEKLLRSTSSHPSQWLIDWIKGGYESSTGLAINEDKALQYTAWWAAVRVISGSIGSLPLIVYKRTADGKERADKHPVYNLLHNRPNPYSKPLTFFETLQAHVLCWGNGFAEIQRDGSGRAVALWPLLPDRTCRQVDDNGVPYYETKVKGIETVKIDDYNVLHIPGLGFDGLTGYSPVQYHKEAIGLGMATKKYGGKTFAAGGAAGGVLEHPGKLSKEATGRLRESWDKTYGGLDNVQRLIILEEGMKFTRTTISPQDAQCLETQKFSVDDIARIFNIPPHMIGSLDRATFSNIEHQGMDYLTRTLFYWLRNWEQECNYKLFMPGEQKTYFCEFLTDAFLRGDISSRYNAYNIARNGGWLCVNDIRRLENMNTIGDKGDIYLEPLNMKPAGTETPEPVKKEPEPAKKEGKTPEKDQKSAILEAHKAALTEIFRKIWVREHKALTAAATNSDTCFDKIHDYYNNHTVYDRDNITNGVNALAVSLGLDAALVSPYLDKFLRKNDLKSMILGIPAPKIPAKLVELKGRESMLAQEIIDDWSKLNAN